MLQVALTLALFVIIIFPLGTYIYHIATKKRPLLIRSLTELTMPFIKYAASIWIDR